MLGLKFAAILALLRVLSAYVRGVFMGAACFGATAGRDPCLNCIWPSWVRAKEVSGE